MLMNNFAKIDLNLLIILQILLEEQNVTRAAKRLHLTQSALSKNLTKLREMLHDPLFLRTSHGLKPTAHAMQLAEKLPAILQSIYLVTQPPEFNPATSDRQFSFAMVESAYETLLPFCIGPLLTNAPNIRLSSYLWSENSMQELLQGQLDFAMAGRELQPNSDFCINRLPEGIAHQLLFTDRQICLLRKNHPLLTSFTIENWNIEQYLNLSHVQVRCEGNDWWALDYHLAESGLKRQISAIVPDFYGAASICAHSNLMFTVPASFARHASKLYPLVELSLPMDFTPLAYVLLWHQRNNDDPGHDWVKSTILDSISRAVLDDRK